MLVDVVLMRSGGNKLPKDQVRGAKPMRGYLEIRTYRPGPGGSPDRPAVYTEALLTDAPRNPERPLSNKVLAGLTECHVSRLSGDEMVIVGTERIGAPGAQREFDQAWWVRVVAVESTKG